MTLPRAIGFIVVSVMTCAVIGSAVGLLLGNFFPGYYRAVFRTGGLESFRPVDVGLGLGLTQGLAAGLLIGCVSVMAVTWHNNRAKEANRLS